MNVEQTQHTCCMIIKINMKSKFWTVFLIYIVHQALVLPMKGTATTSPISTTTSTLTTTTNPTTTTTIAGTNTASTTLTTTTTISTNRLLLTLEFPKFKSAEF